ncbi:bacteriocin-associated integral membrane family protein [Streptomyces spectabilis]|uniref:DUF1430 domain-containing protein n=1 Tax=Streptomyces spectabilis TaxID=68270 RepID=A0A516REU6_STRST|nr:hypothetical protein [Streptomyces spectabilis]QDQ14168.1 hypothetical protein FH965_29290 [Streptomyces spectabilis]
MIFSAMMAFLFVRGLDEQLILGSSAQVWVTKTDDSVSGAQVARAIAAFSDDHKVAVARELPDVKHPDSRRHLYLAAGDPNSDAASWLNDGYPAFSSHITTDVHPIEEIGQRDPRGFYYVFGAPEAADALVTELADLGLGASVQYPLAYSELAQYFAGDELLWSFWVIALAAVTMTGASVLLNAKAYGVLRLQGKSLIGLLARDLKQLAAFWSLAAGTVAAAVLVLLGLYNGLAWLGLFALVTVCLAGVLILLVLAAHAAAVALTFKVGVLRALKGELPARAAFVSTYLVRVPAVLLALGFAMDVTLASQHLTAREDNQENYAQAGDAVTIRLNGSWGGDSRPVVKQVGSWLRRADAAGEIIVAGRHDLQNLSSNARLPQGEILIVNETFLANQPVSDPKGHRYSPAPDNARVTDSATVRLIIPESLASHASNIRKTIPDVFGRMDPEVRRHLKIETSQAKSGQQVFGYNSGDRSPNVAYSPDDDRSLVRDPVLVVVPNGSHILTNDAYTTIATQDGIVFPDPDDVLAPLADNTYGLQAYVAAVNPVGQNAALLLSEAVSSFRLLLFNLIASVAVLLITGVGVCIIHSRKHAQAVFAQHINGWKFTATHRFILVVEGLLAAFLAWWVPVQVWRQNQDLAELSSQGIPAPSPPAQITTLDISAIAVLVVVEFGTVLLALRVFHRRIVKEGAAEA